MVLTPCHILPRVPRQRQACPLPEGPFWLPIRLRQFIHFLLRTLVPQAARSLPGAPIMLLITIRSTNSPSALQPHRQGSPPVCLHPLLAAQAEMALAHLAPEEARLGSRFQAELGSDPSAAVCLPIQPAVRLEAALVF